MIASMDESMDGAERELPKIPEKQACTNLFKSEPGKMPEYRREHMAF